MYVGMSQSTCESCRAKRSTHGLPNERKARWCPGCAKTDGGELGGRAVSLMDSAMHVHAIYDLMRRVITVYIYNIGDITVVSSQKGCQKTCG